MPCGFHLVEIRPLGLVIPPKANSSLNIERYHRIKLEVKMD